MRPLTVIEHLDVIEDLGARFIAGDESSMVSEFIFEIAEEAFDDGIVVTVSFAAHAGNSADPVEFDLIERTHIGRSAVAVMDKARHGSALVDRHAQSSQAQSLASLVAHYTSHSSAREQVEHHGQK